MVLGSLGPRPPSGGRFLFPRMAVGAIVNIPGGDAVYVSSIYMYHSQRLSDQNVGLLSHVAAALERWAGPYILGTDFNVEPSVFLESRCARFRGGRAAVPEATHGSCRTSARA
eukprot:8029549-Pyramimonas_sp.AAC.1